MYDEKGTISASNFNKIDIAAPTTIYRIHKDEFR